MSEKKRNIFVDLFDLFFSFFKLGAVTFGGGYSMLPLLERTLADKKKWTTKDELLDYYAIAQATPGIIAVNVSTFIGFKKRGIAGGIAATLGIITPSIIIITLIAEFISNFESIIWVQKALTGINVSVAALLTYSVFGLTKKNLKRWWNIFFYAGSFTAVYFFKVHSVFVILASILIGVILYFVEKNKGKKNQTVEIKTENTNSEERLKTEKSEEKSEDKSEDKSENASTGMGENK